jgi:hypothetical protein
MKFSKRQARFFFLSFLKHDFKASITVFFVALPLCLGISLASNAPVYSGIIAGIIGGIVVFTHQQITIECERSGSWAYCYLCNSYYKYGFY